MVCSLPSRLIISKQVLHKECDGSKMFTCSKSPAIVNIGAMYVRQGEQMVLQVFTIHLGFIVWKHV